MAVKSICGVIIKSADPEKLANFYARVFGLDFEKESHGGLDIHFGVDIGEVHFGIHPPQNMHSDEVGNASIAFAFNVSSVKECHQNLELLAAEQVSEPRDEGFGLVAAYRDPEGNLFEIVELNYQFDK